MKWKDFFDQKIKDIALNSRVVLDVGGGRKFGKGMGEYAALFVNHDYKTLDNVRDYSPDILGDIKQHQAALEAMVKNYETPDFIAFRGIIKRYNILLSKVDDFYAKQTSLADVLKAVLAIEKPGGIYFTDMLMDKQKSGRVKVVISGVSPDRESLLEFKNNIEKNPNIQNVYFPPENWLKPKDLSFSLQFEINAK